MSEYMLNIAKRAKEATKYAVGLSTKQKNAILRRIADTLIENQSYLEKENKKDIEYAKSENLSDALIDRLLLNEKRIKGMAEALYVISELDDPVGEISEMRIVESGIKVGKMRVPIGVIAVIYESRPNVTSDIAGLTIKSSNVVILRGGKESINSNKAIYNIIVSSLEKEGASKDIVVFVDKPERKYVDELLTLSNYIDLVIPRGGEALIKKVVETSKIPVIKHYKGVCYTFVDKDANPEKAIKIVLNAKLQRPGVCNATEGLLIHKDFPKIRELIEELHRHNVEIRGCKKSVEIFDFIKPAKEEDYSTEFLAPIISLKIVNNVDEAINHIRKYSSQHTDAIISENYSNIMKFFQEVDSSCVIANASTRLHDGGVFGLGAELGISTDKLHARGTMGLKELTTQKYIVFGNGEIRE